MLLLASGGRAEDPEALKLREAGLLRGGVWLGLLLRWEDVRVKPAQAGRPLFGGLLVCWVVL